LERFLNKLEKVATENKLSDTPGNIFNIDESGLPVNKKTWHYNNRKWVYKVHVSTRG